MGKPRAARKQPIVLSSDDESDGRESLPPSKRLKTEPNIVITQNGLRGGPTPTRTLRPRAKSPKPQTSRNTAKSPAKSPAKLKPVHKPIESFFSNVPQAQARAPLSTISKPLSSTPVEEYDDISVSSDDEYSSRRPTALPVRKRDPTPALDVAPKASQRFLRPSVASRSTSTPPPAQVSRPEVPDGRPWTERFGPVSLDELAVHRKKVADVRTWLSDVFSGSSRKRLLLLKGPAGSGKTTTMSLLAQEMGVDIHEWKNPTTTSPASEGFMSVTSQFQDFIGRTGAFGSLTFGEQPRNMQSRPPSTPAGRQKQLVMVEEFPNTFARASSAVQFFRASLMSFLATSTPSASDFFRTMPDAKQTVTPLVMIISETLLSTNTAAADSFTAHRLLGPEILAHPGVSVIEFNPIAPTFMTKALDLVVQKEARQSGRKTSAGPQVIQRLSELGDIRSAISSLQFLCLRGDEDDGWGSRLISGKKKASKNVPLTRMEQESLEMVTQRESTLGIFHAVGRVVYNKRLPEDPANPLPQPPNWFPELRRPKASEVNVDALIDELGTDTTTFIAALHENYALSCDAGDSETTMDAIEGCIDALSDSDLLSPDRFSSNGFGRRNFQGTSADTLRQDEISFQTSVRGLLFHLPTSVKRIAPPHGVMGMKGKATSKGSAYVMYYPASLRIWRQQEEIEGMLDLWTARVQRGELSDPKTGAANLPEANTGGVETWRRSTNFTPQQSSVGKDTDDTDGISHALVGGGGSARYEMLLERLPYLTRILWSSSMRSPSTTAIIREIQKITSFTGHGMSKTTFDADEDEEEDLEPVGNEQWTTDRPDSDTPKKKRRVNIESKKAVDVALASIVEQDVSKLVLSDDDIED